MKLIIDISRYETVLDWAKVAGQVDGVYLKATQGTWLTDRTFDTYRKGCADHGIRWGAYHFYEATTTGIKQAEHMLAVLGADHGQLPPCLDYEPKYIGQFPPRTGALSSIQAFLQTIEQRSGVRPIFYSNPDHIHDLKPIPAWLLTYDLWISHFDAIKPDFEPWAKWVMWQFSEAGSVEGINDAVDLNHAQDDFVPDDEHPDEPTDAEKLEILWGAHPALH